MAEKLRFIDRNRSKFFATAKARVDAYFEDNKISKNANGFMYFKTFFYVGGALLCYGLIMSGAFSLMQMWIFSLFLGFFGACIGFNVSHDGIHGSYSSNATVNRIIGNYSFYLIGGSPYIWSITHNQVHHTFTNIPGHDEDIDVAPGLIRLSPEDDFAPIQKYQHIYAIPLYGITSLNWVLRKDYKKFFQKQIGHIDNSHHASKEYFNLFFFKALYYIMYIVLPLVFLDITWWQFLIGFVSMHIVTGIVLGAVFQLAHVVEGTDFPMANDDGNIEEAWAVHQMQTTANFGRKSWLTTFICGGLNMQVEHHLFPKVCHIHYSAISDILKQTADEFGVPYKENPSFLTALASHYRMLKAFGPDAMEKQLAMDNG